LSERFLPLRVCIDCGKRALYPSDLESFKKDKKGRYGRANLCKECKNRRTRAYYQNHKQKFQSYQREYRKKHKEQYNRNNRVYKSRHQQQIAVENLAYRLVPLGSRCEHCGSTENLCRHHPDYTKPFSIVTLCHSCHMKLHSKSGILGEN